MVLSDFSRASRLIQSRISHLEIRFEILGRARCLDMFVQAVVCHSRDGQLWNYVNMKSATKSAAGTLVVVTKYVPANKSSPYLILLVTPKQVHIAFWDTLSVHSSDPQTLAESSMYELH